jgi:hypothetical protein
MQCDAESAVVCRDTALRQSRLWNLIACKKIVK